MECWEPSEHSLIDRHRETIGDTSVRTVRFYCKTVVKFKEKSKPSVTQLKYSAKPSVTQLKYSAKPSVTQLKYSAKPSVTQLKYSAKH